MQRNHPRRGGHAPDSTGPGDAFERRDRQLGRQAERILSLTLADLDDPLFEDLVLADVQAHHGALTVTLLAPPDRDAAELGRLRERLEAVRGRLRSELASALHRRRVPELILRVEVLPAPGAGS